MTVLGNQILQDVLKGTEGRRKAEQAQNSIRLQESPTPYRTM